MSEPLLVSADELCQMLSVGKSLFYEMKQSGRFGPVAIHFGRRVVWRRSEVESWVEAGCPCRDEWLARRAGK